MYTHSLKVLPEFSGGTFYLNQPCCPHLIIIEIIDLVSKLFT